MAGREHAVRLPDGRTLAVLERGPSDGTPVVAFHGCPGSRLDAAPGLDDALAREGVRWLAVDRPGFGRSDPHRRRTLRSTAGDAAVAAEALGAERFAVYGLSAGGPYAVAVAAAAPERVTHALVVSGVGPPDPAFTEGMRGDVQLLHHLSRRAPWLVAAGMRRARSDPRKALAKAAEGAPPADAEVLGRPEVAGLVAASMREGLRRGGRCVAEDLALLSAPWDVDPRAVAAPVELWHGEDDATVPLAHAERLAALLGDAALRRLPGEGHYLAFARGDELVAALARPTSRR